MRKLHSQLFAADGSGSFVSFVFPQRRLCKNPLWSPPKPITGSTSKNKQANWSFRLISLRNERRSSEAGVGRRQEGDGKESASWGWWIADVHSCEPACTYLHSYAPKLCICVLVYLPYGDWRITGSCTFISSVVFFFPSIFSLSRHQKQPHCQTQMPHVVTSRIDSSDVLQTRPGNCKNYKYTPFYPQEPVR